MTVSLIVALSENNVIGKGNTLPWRLSADLKRLKGLTMGHHIIMGRKTWESLGRPLPGRKHVIITRSNDYEVEGATVVHSIEEALKASKGDDQVFIFGGGEVFKMSLPFVERIYMTRVHTNIDGDAYFPELKKAEWKEISREDHHADEKNEYDYSFIDYQRK